MTKKFIIITAIILLMSVVGCVAAYATIYEKDIENVAVEPEVIPEDEKDIPKDYTSYGSIFFENKFAEKELTLKLYDGTTKDVTYEHSTTFNGTDILKNIYIDKSPTMVIE